MGESKCKTIGWRAFDNCRVLQSVVIPKSVTSIEYGAFVDSSITSLQFEETTGWSKQTSGGTTYAAVDSSLLSNPTTNATNFRNKSGYYDCYWIRSEE